jgi:hypothetical protein
VRLGLGHAWLGVQHARDVLSFLDHKGPLAQEVVRAPRPWIHGRTRHGEDVAALLTRQTSGDQRPRAQFRLNHHDAERQTGDEPIASQEVGRSGCEPHRPFGHQATLETNGLSKRLVFRRMDIVDSAGQDRDGAGGQGAFMRRRVDSAASPR